MQRHTRWVVALIIGFVVIIGFRPQRAHPDRVTLELQRAPVPHLQRSLRKLPHRRWCRSDVAGELSGGLPLDSIHP